MESNPQNSTIISSAENSVSPPSMKRQKILSDKDGDRSDDTLHQEEESKSHLSVEQSKAAKQAPAKNIKNFAAQCVNCRNWRLISTKTKYEEIRERIREVPFLCGRAREWNPDVTCDDPSDVSQEDSSKLWAMDKPNIPQAPPGWERLIKIRSEGSTHFADVSNKPPTGKRLRSLNEVSKYLKDHAETVAQGVELSQFSFEIPSPLQEDYVIKRSQKSENDALHAETTKLIQSEEVQPIDREAALGDPWDNNEDQPDEVAHRGSLFRLSGHVVSLLLQRHSGDVVCYTVARCWPQL